VRKRGLSLKHLKVALLSIVFFLSTDLDACTAFIVKQGNQILVGNNEDWTQTNVRIWFVPGSAGKHGAVYFGFAQTPEGESHEGGMNDRGLFFDGFSAPAIEDSNPLNKPLYRDSVGFPDRALEQCASVDEVAALASKFHLPLHHAMWMFGDRYGGSIIIEGEKTVSGNGHYQICTNFRQSELQGSIPSCWRYRTADSLLQNMKELTVEYCRDILDASHLKITQYSYILDPNSGQIYFYHFHDFSRAMLMNIAEELAYGPHFIDVLSRFPRKLGVTMFAEQGKAYFLSFSMMFFFVSLAFWSGRFLFRRIVRRKSGGTLAQGKYDAIPGVIGGLLCAFIGLYLVILLGYPEMIPYTQELIIGNSQPLRLVLFAIPWLSILVLGVSIYFAPIIWKRRLWSLIGRIHYTLIALVALADVVIWFSWGITP